jgi:hypothetical protein
MRVLKPLVHLEEPLWQVLLRLQRVVNENLRRMGKKPLRLSGVITLVIRHALLRTASGVLHEYNQMGLQQLSDTLLDGAEEGVTAATWLPEPTPAPGSTATSQVPNGRRAITRPRPPFFWK